MKTFYNDLRGNLWRPRSKISIIAPILNGIRTIYERFYGNKLAHETNFKTTPSFNKH